MPDEDSDFRTSCELDKEYCVAMTGTTSNPAERVEFYFGSTTEVQSWTRRAPLLSSKLGIADVAVALPTAREILFFEKVAVTHLENTLRRLPETDRRRIEKLISHGIVTDVHLSSGADVDSATYNMLSTGSLMTSMTAGAVKAVKEDPDSVRRSISRTSLRNQLSRSEQQLLERTGTDVDAAVERAERFLHKLFTRPLSAGELERLHALTEMSAGAMLLRLWSPITLDEDGHTATPLLPGHFGVFAELPGIDRSDQVMSVVINRIPEPAPNTDIETLIRFRQDEDAIRSLRRLRGWMKAAATSNKTEAELRDELQVLLDDYEAYMNVHRMKTKSSMLETVITTTADALENVAKLKLGEAARSLFQVKEKKMALLEAELAAPGREVAFIAKVRQAFSE